MSKAIGKMSPEEIIRDKFGIPVIEGLKNENLSLITNAESIPGSDLKGYRCKDGNYKFCLVKVTQNNRQLPIFSMDFFRSSDKLLKLTNSPACYTLEYIHVHDPQYRNRGIASYYLSKLVALLEEENIPILRIHPDPDANNFKHTSKEKSLNIKQLKEFYIRKCENQKLKIDFY
ncbi:GNAT family N-acetyltransferase [Oceanobacillus jordanicus]|uniref:GNAT family N-acetyltransferase n=1 Tax=Oceanobacillus jordanicus TaxID=2867266 RepID=A0AAW5B5X7_9BACI|nr:GNAT family N-acetyltransferase [Oceanobacillus jordanicus]MCG3418953.1 GNAT family N-acetyltransferase [Oceanobacillus jordanicus]